MKKYPGIFILIWWLMNFSPIIAQYKNRIHLGMGGEDGYLGMDYSRDICRSKLFLGIGCGLGTGWTAYARYEPINWYGLRPFVSSGVSHSFNGTLITSAGTSVFSASAGLNYLPKLGWNVLPALGIGITGYRTLTGKTEGGTGGFGPLIKLGVAFP